MKVIQFNSRNTWSYTILLAYALVGLGCSHPLSKPPRRVQPLIVTPHEAPTVTGELGERGYSAIVEFWLTNPNDKAVDITAAVACCGCEVLDFACPRRIEPQECAKIKLLMVGAKYLEKRGSVALQTIPPEASPKLLVAHMLPLIKPPVVLSPEWVNAGELPPNRDTFKVMLLTAESTGTAPWLRFARSDHFGIECHIERDQNFDARCGDVELRNYSISVKGSFSAGTHQHEVALLDGSQEKVGKTLLNFSVSPHVKLSCAQLFIVCKRQPAEKIRRRVVATRTTGDKWKSGEPTICVGLPDWIKAEINDLSSPSNVREITIEIDPAMVRQDRQETEIVIDAPVNSHAPIRIPVVATLVE